MPDSHAIPAMQDSQRKLALGRARGRSAGCRFALWHIDFDLPEIGDVDAGKFVDAAITSCSREN